MRRPCSRVVVGGLLATALACGDENINPVGPTPPTGSNRAPQVAAPIPDQTLSENETASIDLSLHFTDPDGDPLTFEAASSATRTVSASVAGSVVTITAVSAGTAEVTVTAADPGGLTAALTFRATAEPPSNRAPRVAAPIPDQTLRLRENETANIDLSLHFTDPDGDPLTFEATSSDSRTVSVSVAGSVVTITAVSAGTADVTVTAADPGGLTAALTFRATVDQPSNRAPRVAAPVPDQTLKLRETANIDLSLHFTDPDGDPLTFEATSSDSRSVSVSVAGSVVTITAVSAGAAEVTVTAADPGGLTAALTFRATAEPPSNRAPRVAAPIPDQTLRLRERETANIDLSLHFTDPDGDPLTFEAASSAARTVSASVAGSVVTITAVSAGTAEVTVTAADPGGLTAALTFRATAEPPRNRAPLVSAPILGRVLKLNENEKATVDLSLHFTDPDGDPLTFEATSSNTRVATADVLNGTLTILAQDLGTASVTVVANDPDGLGARQVFSVTVESGTISAELEVTKCQADGLGLVNVTVEGTVRAVAPLSSARVTAYLDTQRLGEQTLGDLAAGETRGFLIRGAATVGSSSRCLVELSAGRRNMTSAAPVSFP